MVGRPAEFALDFQAADTVSNLSWPSWQRSAWGSWTRKMLIGTTLAQPGGVWNTGWDAAARGDYDTMWYNMGVNLVNNGHPDAVLRGNHEFNGDWFNHRVMWGQEASFIQAWRRWVTVLRTVPGQNFSFDWNPTHGVLEKGLKYAETAYPGDDYVTNVALDVYDDYYDRGWLFEGTVANNTHPPTATERSTVRDHIMNGQRGMKYWSNFAKAHGKKLALPEWGPRSWKEEWDGLIHGGGDHPEYVQMMYDFIVDPANNIAYHAPWEDPGQGFYDNTATGGTVRSKVPNARALYLQLFCS